MSHDLADVSCMNRWLIAMRNIYCMIQLRREAASTGTKKRGTRIQTSISTRKRKRREMRRRTRRGTWKRMASGSQPSVGQQSACGQWGAVKKLEGRHIITEVDEDERRSSPAEDAKNWV